MRYLTGRIRMERKNTKDRHSRKLSTDFKADKGDGAALLFMLMGFAGTLICLHFRHDRYICQAENKTN